MTPQKAIEILNLAAEGHALTTGEELWTALRMGVRALILQRDRDREGHS